MSDYAHLFAEAMAEEPQGDTLSRLNTLIERLQDLEEAITQKTAELADLKKAWASLSGDEIPQLLLSSGLSELKTDKGYKVIVRPDVSVTVKDYDAFSAWLDERGDGDILKTSMELGKLDDVTLKNMRFMLAQSFDLYPEIKRVVHPQTLKKYIRDVCLLGEESPDYDGQAHMPVNDLPDCLNTYTFYKTTVKK